MITWHRTFEQGEPALTMIVPVVRDEEAAGGRPSQSEMSKRVEALQQSFKTVERGVATPLAFTVPLALEGLRPSWQFQGRALPEE